jgi:hypothetical protein
LGVRSPVPERGNSDFPGDFDLKVTDGNSTRHRVRVNSNRETRTKSSEKSFAGCRLALVGERRCVGNLPRQRRKFTDVGPVTKPSHGHSAAAELADILWVPSASGRGTLVSAFPNDWPFFSAAGVGSEVASRL